MNNSDFLLNRIGDAINRTSDFSLFSFAITSFLAFGALLLALNSFAPPSLKEDNLYPLLLLIGLTIILVMIIYVTRLFGKHITVKPKCLKKIQLETYFARNRIDAMPEEKIRELIVIIESIEESKRRDVTFYNKEQESFVGLLSQGK